MLWCLGMIDGNEFTPSESPQLMMSAAETLGDGPDVHGTLMLDCYDVDDKPGWFFDEDYSSREEFHRLWVIMHSKFHCFIESGSPTNVE